MFEHDDARQWWIQAPTDTPIEVQKKVAFVIAFGEALRVSENHKLTLDDVTFDEKRNEFEIFVRKSKNQKSRSFILDNSGVVATVKKYIDSLPTSGKRWLYPVYNVVHEKWNCNQRRGQNWKVD